MLSLSDFKTKASFGFLIATYRNYFVVKYQHELVWPKLVFLAILAGNLRLIDNSDMLANSCLTSVECSLYLQIRELSKKWFARASYHVYLVFRLRLIEIDF